MSWMLEMTRSDLSLTGFVQKAQRKHASSTHQDFFSPSLDFTMSASLLTGTGEDWTASRASLLFLERLHLWDKYSCFHFLKNWVATRMVRRLPPPNYILPSLLLHTGDGLQQLTQTESPTDCLVQPCFWEGAISGCKPQCGDLLASSCSLSPQLGIQAASLKATCGVSSSPQTNFLVCVSGFKFSLFIRPSVILI